MYSLATAIVLAAILVWASLHVLKRSSRKKLPPGPYPFPIIGNILQMGQNPQHTLANMSKTYGPLMSLQLGSQYTVVVSSQEVAKAVLQEHDQALSNRTVVSALQANDFDKHSVAFSAAGSAWKKGRKLGKEHLFATRRLDESQGLRQQKLKKLRDYLGECAGAGLAVNIGEALFTTTVNLMSFTLFSTDFASYDSDVSQDLKKTVEGFVLNLEVPNIADFFPVFKPFDPQRIKRRSEFYMGKLLQKFGDIINKRLESRAAGSSVDSSNKYDLLETLVNIMEDREYNLSVDDIKYLFLDLFFGGTHTTTSTVEWAMTELLFNPEKMAKVKNELRTVIGKNKQVEESDISRLPYMQAVIKETLRIHPVAPFLIPRRAIREVEINGYTIPKNTQIFVNVWAIGRDSSLWSNPTSFEPERFLNNTMDYRGRDFAFLPFGSGRRICIGLPLADRMMPLMLASLIQEFDWKLEPGVKPQDGIAIHSAVPLMAIPIKV